MKRKDNSISRRRFIQTGGAILAGSAWGVTHAQEIEQKSEKIEKINQYRKLGRTGFQASDISMGCTRNRESNVFRYAYDKGINYFDMQRDPLLENETLVLFEDGDHISVSTEDETVRFLFISGKPLNEREPQSLISSLRIACEFFCRVVEG